MRRATLGRPLRRWPFPGPGAKLPLEQRSRATLRVRSGRGHWQTDLHPTSACNYSGVSHTVANPLENSYSGAGGFTQHLSVHRCSGNICTKAAIACSLASRIVRHSCWPTSKWTAGGISPRSSTTAPDFAGRSEAEARRPTDCAISKKEGEPALERPALGNVQVKKVRSSSDYRESSEWTRCQSIRRQTAGSIRRA
jgi:hypothetical protein